jgi:transglutaminase-like putative cysteine protease
MHSSVSADTPVTYQVVHTTKYTYSEAVSVSHHVARVKPRGFAAQECLEHQLHIEPAPAVVRPHQDYFGNGVSLFIVEQAHKELIVRATSTVRVHGRGVPAAASHGRTPATTTRCRSRRSSVSSIRRRLP